MCLKKAVPLLKDAAIIFVYCGVIAILVVGAGVMVGIPVAYELHILPPEKELVRIIVETYFLTFIFEYTFCMIMYILVGII